MKTNISNHYCIEINCMKKICGYIRQLFKILVPQYIFKFFWFQFKVHVFIKIEKGSYVVMDMGTPLSSVVVPSV